MNRRIRKKQDKKITEAINGLIFIAERREQQRHHSVSRIRTCDFVPCAAGCRTGLFGVDHSDRRRCSRLYDAAAGA